MGDRATHSQGKGQGPGPAGAGPISQTLDIFSLSISYEFWI